MLGVLPGTMGLLQATEVIKLIVGTGEPLVGRLLLYEALGATFTELKVRRDPDCPICSRDARGDRRRGDGRVPRLRGVLRRGRVGSAALHGHCSHSPCPALVDRRRASEVDADGDSVGDVLRSVTEQHPATQSQLFADGGDLNRYVNVYLNDEDVRVLDGLETPVGTGDVLVILPAMAGGAG